jgi:hypothetical protein
MGAMRKDLGNLGTRTLACCSACGQILDAPVEPVRRIQELTDHILDAHPASFASFRTLDVMLWGTGSVVPRMRRPL